MTSGIKFRRTQLAGYKPVLEPNKYKLIVQNNVSEKNRYSENGRDRYIVSLKAIAKDQIEAVKTLFADTEEVAIEETNGLFLTGAIWVNGDEQPALPMKGEEVEVAVDYVVSREGEEVLRVTNMRVLPAKQTANFNLAELFADVTTPAETLQHT